MWAVVKHWLISVMVATNQLANAASGGDPQMSLSARAGFAREHGGSFAKGMCSFLDKFDRHKDDPQGRWDRHADHCQIAIIEYRARKAEHE